MDPPYHGVEETYQGNGTKDTPKIEPTNQPPKPSPKTGKKLQDQSTGSSSQKKKKAQKTPTIYELTYYDMEKNFK
jgi:hypothetical protein